jgi:hypothetical protein
MTKQTVFLSYSFRDKKVANALERALEEKGFATFDPAKNVRRGSDIRKAVIEGMRKSNWVIVLQTQPRTASSSWIGYEVGSAGALGKDIVIMKPNSFSAADLPSDLSGLRVFDFDPASPSEGVNELVSSFDLAS